MILINVHISSGYAWFPQKEGYQCPPDTNTVNRGGSDEPLFVKVESQWLWKQNIFYYYVSCKLISNVLTAGEHF